jgi:hypothetical protein
MTNPTNTTAPPLDYDLIESAVARGNKNDHRVLLQNILKNISNLQQASGVPSSTSKSNISSPPQGSLSAAGANGAFQLGISPAPTNPPAPQWHEISYSPVKGFTSGITTMEPTQATQVTLNLPGTSYFFRLRSSFNKTVYNQPVIHGQTPASSGLVSSAATESAAAFNQTNLGIVNSTAVGSTAVVSVSGADAALSSVPTIKGAAQSVTPGATLIGAEPGSTQYVGFHQSAAEYVMGANLPDVFDDAITPIGKVSVVSTAAPTLPVIDPVVVNGYIVGYNVVNGGAGASQDYDLAFGAVGAGAGASFGVQSISGGVLQSVAAGNPGNGLYSPGTTVTASGGIGGGAPGGGTSQGTTDGRLTT